jgi:ribosomal protein S27AE
MKTTKWARKGKWELQQRTFTVWEVVCPRCGAIANHGYDEREAIDVAEEDGWRNGLCPDCYAQELGS